MHQFIGRLIVIAALLGWPGAAQPVGAEPGGPRTVSAAATLSILKGSVQRIPAAGGQPQPGVDGMNLAVGDRVLTGPKSEALVTFLDGSTLFVMPDSDVAVKRAELQGTRSSIGIQINLGMVWARVVRLADPKSSFSLESNTATATVHDGLIGGHQFADGKFVCWTKAGDMAVTDKLGQTVVLKAGEKTEVQGGKAPVPVAFFANQSSLRVTTSPGVLPLMVMDDQVRVAGFVAPGIEVNQVFGSFTGIGSDDARIVEVPAGLPGPFALILEGRQDGPFSVKVSGLLKGAPVYQQELTGTIKKGQRLVTRISQQLDPATAGEPKTAKVQGGSATELAPFEGPLPGKILLSPEELASAGR